MVRELLKFGQLNVGKREPALIELTNKIVSGMANIFLLTEQLTRRDKPKKMGDLGNFISKPLPFGPIGKIYDRPDPVNKPRAGIWVEETIRKRYNCTQLHQFCNQDTTTLSFDIDYVKGGSKKLIVASVYMPSYDINKKFICEPVTTLLRNLTSFASNNNYDLIIGADTNAHSISWHCPTDNTRGLAISDFCIEKILFPINNNDIPTFVSGNRESIIDVTFVNENLISKINDWKVDILCSFSDHRMIFFNMSTDNEEISRSKIKKTTSWKKYLILLKKNLEKINLVVTSPQEFDTLANDINNAIVQAQEMSCKEKVIARKDKKCWFDEKLEAERRNCRKAFHAARLAKSKNKNYADDLINNYKMLRDNYRESCRKTASLAWKNHTEKLDKIHETARLQKALENPRCEKLGTLKKTDGSFTKDLKESYEYIFSNHFPGTKPWKNRPQTNFCVDNDLEIIHEIINDDSIKEAVNSLGSWKACGDDKIHPIQLQKGLNELLPFLNFLFKKSLEFSYLPTCWLNCEAIFLHKPGKSQSSSDGYRCITLINHIPKILEKIIERRLRAKELKENPLHDAQKGFTANRSIDDALHEVVSEIESALGNDCESVAVFIDFTSAFNLISFEKIKEALAKFKTPPLIIKWLSQFLEDRIISAREDPSKTKYSTPSGVPQGGVAAPLMFNLVIDPLIRELTKATNLFNKNSSHIKA